MANNPYVNKVVLADGTSLIDLSGDTLQTAKQLMDGVTAHDKTGAAITGTWSLAADVFPVGSLYATESSSDDPSTILGFGTWTKYAPADLDWNDTDLDWNNTVGVTSGVYVWKRTA